MYQKRAAPNKYTGIAVFPAIGYWKDFGLHMSVAIYTNKGYRFYDAELKKDITNEFDFIRFYAESYSVDSDILESIVKELNR